jgi:glyoxylase-like metal-dependent hydrolase (beta-lactamase superfamily II)
MEIEKIIVGELQSNCYLAIDIDTQRCVIIDPGDNANAISEEILSQDIEPIAILATHGHFDHVMAGYELQLAFDIPFIIHSGDLNLLSRMQSSAKHWLNHEIIEKTPREITEIDNQNVIEFGSSRLEWIHTPGHTPGGITLFNNDKKIVFTGDTLFKNAVGRADLSYSNPKELSNSVQEIKTNFNGFQAYPGHGEEFYV